MHGYAEFADDLPLLTRPGQQYVLACSAAAPTNVIYKHQRLLARFVEADPGQSYKTR